MKTDTQYIYRYILLFLLFPVMAGNGQTEGTPEEYLYVNRPPVEVPVWSESEDEWIWDWETLDSIIVHDTITDTLYISRLEDITLQFGISFDEYVRRFMMFKDEQDSLSAITSERLYLNYFLPMLASDTEFMNKRLVCREYTIAQDQEYTELRLKDYPMNYFYALEGIPMDVMLTCYGTKNTDIFLQSPYARQTTIEQLFSAIYFTRNRTIDGINFYFPDYSFREKREMAQFVKSLSLVTDSSRIEGIRGLKLYLTFDKEEGLKNKDFLCCLTQMADSVFLLDQQTELNAIPVMNIVDSSDAEVLPVFSKMRNQLYLARYATGGFPETNPEEFLLSDIRAIMNSDYDDNLWETYFLILIGIILLIIVFVLFYRFSSVFSGYISKNMDYMYALLIMLVLEIYLLAFTMLECMSKDNIFTFGDKNRDAILWMPFLFLFIIPMMKSIRNRRNLP